MPRAVAILQSLLVLVALFLPAVPADLACCAGLADSHGDDCCASTEANALARSCCDGDSSSAIAHSEPRMAPATLQPARPVGPPAPTLRRAAWLLARILPEAPNGGLYTLHSAFLI